MTQLPEIPCGLCSTAFVPKQRTQKFCSKTCGSRFHDRQREIRDKEKRLAKSRAYYANNTEQHKRAQKSWYDRNTEQLRRYREMNREQRLAAMKAWHAEHRDEANERRLSLYYDTHEESKADRRERYRNLKETDPARWAETMARSKQYARERYPWQHLIGAAKGRAEKKGVPFCLSLEWGAERWTGFCEMTGVEFVMAMPGRPGPRIFSPSIDRIEPKLGYVPDNCRFILWGINALKGEATDAEVMLIAEAIVNSKLSL